MTRDGRPPALQLSRRYGFDHRRAVLALVHLAEQTVLTPHNDNTLATAFSGQSGERVNSNVTVPGGQTPRALPQGSRGAL